MPQLHDSASAVDAILKASDLVRVPGLPAGQPSFDAGQSNVLLEGDMPAGGMLTGRKALVVQGSLHGAPPRPCVVEVEEDVVITGSARSARVFCRNLYVDGSLRGCQVCAAGSVSVAGSVADARITLGDYQVRRRNLEAVRRELDSLHEKRDALDLRIAQDERRLHRACQATRSPLTFGVGRLVTQERNRVGIDLSTLYASLGSQPTAALRPSINEFFAKGIIGYLARANRQYIADNPAREKVFMQLLRQLRGLVMDVFARDLCLASAQTGQQQIDQVLAGMRDQAPTLRVHGDLEVGSEVEFVLPRVQRLQDGQMNFVHQTPRLRALRADQPGSLHLEFVDAEGEPWACDVGASELQHVCLSVRGRRISWVPVAPPPS